MYNDYDEFGWEFIVKMYMPNGIVRRYFDYMRALKIMISKAVKEKSADKSFQDNVHSKTRRNTATASRHTTYIRKVDLPKGAENETFD